MTRWKLTLEYDGRPFVGWQRQDNGPSVQAAVERAVAAFCGESATLFAAGRTDAGVHATGQVAHVDIAKGADADTVRDALNFHLKPDPVVVQSAEAAASDFHARFSATMRHYRYRILNRRPPPALDRGRVWHVGVPLDPAAMHAAAQILAGKHDFTSFRAVACQSDSPIKTLDAISVTAAGEEVHLRVQARSFLHHQVRNIAGTLKLVGEGKWTAGDVAAALAARDRSRAGPTAPPEGLYLIGVDY
ncbi:MAG: tRNA pseudouridine(38-40) synthase TruA [Alphaproteobacteria bacterium]|nr:tRNA pseudouridine(38-40) synthase TruA [Alphaproteobacteria bacterium]